MAPNSLEVVLTGKKDDTRVNEKQAATRQIDWIRNSKTASDPTLLIISASASASPPALACRRTLTDLPHDIHRVVFDNLCPVSSTCLGLTSKIFYRIHFSLHGKVDLQSYSDETYFGNRWSPPHMLYHYLRKWMEPDYVWFPYGDGLCASKFVEVEKMVESKRRRLRGGWTKRKGGEL